MRKIDKDNLGYLGLEFQLRLVNQLITDNKFANSIIDILNPNYFDDEYLRIIVALIKDAYNENQTIPDIGSLGFRLLETLNDDIKKRFAETQLLKIKNANTNDFEYVQKRARNFCKTQELKKATDSIRVIIDKGDVDRYEECEKLLKDALVLGDAKELGIDVFHDINSVLSDDFRKPIPTGIKGLDSYMNGGLSRGELGVILAAFGVGKTTMITKIANSAKDRGCNVLQIFFEDMPKVIQRKHLACWSGYELNDLKYHKEELIELVTKKDSEPGELKLMKFPSDGTNMQHIRQYVRMITSQGFKPDMILIDYIDCLQPSRKFDDIYAGEGSVMREFETLLAEFDIAGWTACQGNRCLWIKEHVKIKDKGVIQIGDVIEGDMIITHKGYKRITKVFPIQKQAVYKIKLKSGKEINVSSKHEFPVKYGKLKSIATGLSIGDELLTKK